MKHAMGTASSGRGYANDSISVYKYCLLDAEIENYSFPRSFVNN